MKEKAYAAGKYTMDKAEEYQVKEKAYAAGKWTAEKTYDAGSYTYNQGKEAQEHYDNGNFADHAKQKAKDTGAFLSTGAKSMFEKSKNLFKKSSPRGADDGQQNNWQNNNYDYDNGANPYSRY